MSIDEAREPEAASHAWCVVCRSPQPYRTRLIHPASRRNKPALEGNDLVCQGCESVVATVYVKAQI